MSRKKLARSQNRMATGVLAGIAEYIDHDPTVWRLGFIFFLIFTGLMPGVLMYVIAYFLMPKTENFTHVTYRVVEE